MRHGGMRGVGGSAAKGDAPGRRASRSLPHLPEKRRRVHVAHRPKREQSPSDLEMAAPHGQRQCRQSTVAALEELVGDERPGGLRL